MGDWGLRISKDGEDVKTCEDIDCVVTSKYSNLKGTLSGTGSKAVSSGSNYTVTITHSLEYIPFGQLFIRNPGTSYYFLAPLRADGPGGGIFCQSKTSTSQFKIYLENTTDSSQTFVYKYFIFIDKGKL